jgi:hypothetical protein
MKIADAAELLGCSYNNLMVIASAYKKRHGRHPAWYLSSDGIKIDIEWFKKEKEKKAELINYSALLYHTIADHGIKDYTQSVYISKMTGDNIQGWVNYLSKDMWIYSINDTEIIPRTSSRIRTYIQMAEEILFSLDPQKFQKIRIERAMKRKNAIENKHNVTEIKAVPHLDNPLREKPAALKPNEKAMQEEFLRNRAVS